jgi:hypothetical protein
MQPWWLVIIAISVSIAGYLLISYAFKIYPIVSDVPKIYISLIIGVVPPLVKWLTQGSLSINGVVRGPTIFQQNTTEDRQSYFLNVKRISGKERPKDCKGRLEIKEKNIDDYLIWRTTRKGMADIGTDDDLLLFEISKKNIIIHRDARTPIEEPYTQFEDRHVIVSVDAANMKACKPYKKKISDIVKQTKPT